MMISVQLRRHVALLSARRFLAWLERAQPGEVLAYHRGLLAHDRARSDLTETERRYVARIADAAFEAAEQGHVYLVQRRHGPGDFSYLAIKAGGGVCRAAPPIRTTDLAAARLPSHPRRKDQPWRSPSLP